MRDAVAVCIHLQDLENCFGLVWAYKARLALYAQIKQKYQKWIIHRKLTVATSEREGKLSNPRGRAARARCMKKIYGNLRSPAHERHAGAMQLFCAAQRYSMCTDALQVGVCVCHLGGAANARARRRIQEPGKQ